jgi:hypothetical protein
MVISGGVIYSRLVDFQNIHRRSTLYFLVFISADKIPILDATDLQSAIVVV